MFKHVLVATDGSDNARKAVRAAADIAAGAKAELTIVHVLMHGRPAVELSRMAEVEHIVPHVARAADVALENVPGTMDALVGYQAGAPELARVVTAIGEKIVEDAKALAREHGVAKVDGRVENGDYAETILDMAAKVGADMVVVGSRGLGGVKRLLLGSVSQKVSQLANCTVMIVR